MAKRICLVDDCERNAFGHGWCSRHYTAWRRHGDPLYVGRVPLGSVCEVDGCESPPVAKNLCSPHYAKNRKHGDPLYVVAYDRREPCKADGCTKQSRRYGYCEMHSQRFKKYGTWELPERERPLCRGPECDRTVDPIQSKTGLCRSHYAQTQRGKALAPLEISSQLKGRPATCTQEGCDRAHKARGLCKVHNEWAAIGKPLDGEVELRLPPGPCSVEGCESLRIAYSYCPRHYSRRIDRWRKYGITPELADLIHESQGRACAICLHAMEIDAMHVDHDHACCSGGNSCGECVRGLLCPNCNLGLGQFKDDSGRLERAVAYLRRSQT